MTIERLVGIGLSTTNFSFTDVTAVFNQDYQQVFSRARAMKSTILSDAKLMEHPVETGITITDHIVYNPIEIELSLMLASEDYQEVYQNIKSLYSTAQLLIVQTRVDTYENMLMYSIPYEESPETYDTVLLAMRLRQVLIVTPVVEPVPENPADKSTVARGVVQAQPETVQEAKKTDSKALEYFRKLTG